MYKLSTSTTETTIKLKDKFISHKSDLKNVYIFIMFICFVCNYYIRSYNNA